MLGEFSLLCERLAGTTKKLEKRALMAEYLGGLSVEDAARAALYLAGAPFAETDPRQLQVGGSTLSKAVALLSGADAKGMHAAYRRRGDLGDAAFDLLSVRAAQSASHFPEPALTLTDVDEAFAGLAQARGPASKLALLLALFGRATPLEARYLIKLATGDMRTGVKQSLVEEAMAAAYGAETALVRRAVMLNGSLAEVVCMAAAGTLSEAHMRLFHPLGFMLASPVDSVDEALTRFAQEVAAEVRAQTNTRGMTEVSPQADATGTEEVDVQADTQRTTEISYKADVPRSVEVNAQKIETSSPSSSPVHTERQTMLKVSHVSEPLSATDRDTLTSDGNLIDPPLPSTVEATSVAANAPPSLRAAQVEDKYDGIRAQLHCGDASQPERVGLFSRNREDLAESFPELIEAFSTFGEEVILDGEILAWQPAPALAPSPEVVHSTELAGRTDSLDSGRALPFASLQQRLGRKRVTREMREATPVVFMAFDLLYQRGDLLLERPLSERRARLEALVAAHAASTDGSATAPVLASQGDLFAPSPDAQVRASKRFARLMLTSSVPFESAEQLDAAYTEARSRGNEGVMLKAAASLYQPGRRGLAWLKLKRELATLDVVITGAEFGNGRRAGVLSDYTFAVRSGSAHPGTSPDPDSLSSTLLNVGKAYSGLTDKEIEEISRQLHEQTIEEYGSFRTVEPTIVLEVAFNNVTRSTRHNSGFALRFPRILRIRTDKPVEEVDTLARVEEIYAGQPDRPSES
jgi:DNA ligase-1